jgi:carboxylesterase type B
LNCRDVDCLRAADVNAILAGQQAFTEQMSTVFSGAKYYIPFAPVIDGALLTRQPVDGGAEGALVKPILMGTNRNEAVIFVEGEAITPGSYSAWAASLFGKDFQKVIAKYPARNDSNNSDLWARVQTDNFLICSTRYVAANAKAPIYAYLFNHQPSFKVWGGPACREGNTVCHGDELPFVFHTADKIGGSFTAAEERLSNTMMDHWTNFATHLDPNGAPAKKGEARWPPFTSQEKDYLALDATLISVQTDPYREACDFWNGIGYALIEPWR